MNKCLFNALLICHRSSDLRPPDRNVPTRIIYDGVLVIITRKRVCDCHQGTNWNAADK